MFVIDDNLCDAMLMPTLFISHGGGPLPVMGAASQAEIARHFKDLFEKGGPVLGEGNDAILLSSIKSILVVSAHWEEGPGVKVTSCVGRHSLLYDYYGFPEETYKYVYPVHGDPSLSKRVVKLLSDAGIDCAEDSSRGLDHGVFIPLMLALPKADIPVVSLSLNSNLDPEFHMQMGRALRPLRNEGVVIIGSGSSFHNMDAFFGRVDAGPMSSHFDAFLNQACTESGERWNMLSDWENAPYARQAHPREEHLLPLMVVAGAASGEDGKRIFNGKMMHASLSSFMFGKL